MKRVTLADVAKELNIAASTVSRALSGDKNVSWETREIIQETAVRLGYKCSATAAQLQPARKNRIGVIVPEMHTPFFARIIDGIQSDLSKVGVKVIIMQSGEDPEQEKINLRLMETLMVDGLIVGISHKDSNQEEFRRLIDKGLPVVFYDRIPSFYFDVSKVVVDDYANIFSLVEHLIHKGIRQIAHIKAPVSTHNSYIRYKAYRDALEKHGIPYRDELVVKSASLRVEDGEKAAAELLGKHIPVDAIVAYADTLAVGVMRHLQSRQIRVPDDIAVTGFSGGLFSEMAHPQLTTVDVPLFEMGEAAAKLILRKINDPSAENRTVVLDTQIQLRGSTEKA